MSDDVLARIARQTRVDVAALALRPRQSSLPVTPTKPRSAVHLSVPPEHEADPARQRGVTSIPSLVVHPSNASVPPHVARRPGVWPLKGRIAREIGVTVPGDASPLSAADNSAANTSTGRTGGESQASPPVEITTDTVRPNIAPSARDRVGAPMRGTYRVPVDIRLKQD